MGWLEGLLTGYASRHYDIQKEKRREAELAAEREGKALESLLNSSHPEIKDLAAAGILDLANPRRRATGLAGWMGDMQKSPHLPAIQRARQRILDAQSGTDEEYDAVARSLGPGYGRTLGPRPTGGAAPPTPSVTNPSGQVKPPATGAAPGALPSTALVTGPPTTPAPTPAPTPPPVAPPPTPPGAFNLNAATQPPPAPPAFSFNAAGPPPGINFNTRGPVPGVSPSPVFGESPAAPQAGPPPAPPQAGPPQEPVAADPAAAAAAAAAPPPAPAAVAAAAQAAPAPAAAATPPPTMAGGGLGPVDANGQFNPAGVQGQVGAGLPNATTHPVGTMPPVRGQRTQLPGIFPTAADLAGQKEQAEVEGQVRGWQTLYRQMGDPDWERKGIEAVLASKRGAAGQTLREGNPRELPDGSWVQDLYDPITGEVKSTIPHQGPLAGGTVGTQEQLAFELYGAEGENPRATIRRLSPKQMARVGEEMRHRTALRAGEVALARAQALSDAPLTSQAKSQLIETLNGKWQRLQDPIRETNRAFQQMVTGLRQFRAGERTGSVEMIRVAFERILDPTSVVREGEYARQVNGLSLTNRLEGMWQRLIEGGGEIEETELAGMVESARQFMVTLQGWNDHERERIEDRANGYGIDPGLILGGGLRNPASVIPGVGAGAGGGTGTGTGGAPGDINWDTPLRWDPVNRRMVPAP